MRPARRTVLIMLGATAAGGVAATAATAKTRPQEAAPWIGLLHSCDCLCAPMA